MSAVISYHNLTGQRPGLMYLLMEPIGDLFVRSPPDLSQPSLSIRLPNITRQERKENCPKYVFSKAREAMGYLNLKISGPKNLTFLLGEVVAESFSDSIPSVSTEKRFMAFEETDRQVEILAGYAFNDSPFEYDSVRLRGRELCFNAVRLKEISDVI